MITAPAIREGQGVRVCTACKEEKPLTLDWFSANTLGRLGFSSQCRPCRNAIVRRHHHANKTKRNKQQAEWRRKNPTHLQKWKASSSKNRKSVLESQKKWRDSNREKAILMTRTWQKKNIERVRATRCRSEKKRRQRPDVKLCNRVRCAIFKSIRSGSKAGRGWESLVGYTLGDLRAHLEAIFQPGMSWENAGKWHLDHIRPQCSFDFETPDDPDFKKCWSLSNLQPLWGSDNCRKAGKWSGDSSVVGGTP